VRASVIERLLKPCAPAQRHSGFCDFQRNCGKEKSWAFGFATKYIPVAVARQPNELSVEKSSASVEKVGVSIINIEKVYMCERSVWKVAIR
jgi:hypothetical protein